MVYRGKPSKACLPCRRRKLVCDLKEQGCSQCRRAQLLCHGYRDTEALRVTDQSFSVRRKNLDSASDSRSKSKARSKVPSPLPMLVPIFRYAEAIPQSLSIPMVSQAKDLFYYNYVVGTLKPFDFLETVCSLTSKDDHLSTSMDAVALAYLNYQRHAPNAQSAARKSYISALRLMNKAIQDPEVVKKDSTMLAILLLDLYEKITNQEPKYEGAWAAHLQGALKLVNMRGDEQFDDPIALRMLVRVTTNEIISCVASHRPIPEEIMALRAKITSHSSSLDSKSKESDLMIEFATLRHELESGNMPDDKAIAAIKDCDGRFLALSLDIQPTWQYEIVQVAEKTSHHWEAHHHLYPCEQMVKCGICFGSPPSKTSPLIRQATETIESMASEICASVPQYIEELSTSVPSATTARPASIPRAQTMSLNPTHHLPCYKLLFPLYVAAQSATAPAALRPWAISQLRFMAEYHAMPNANRVAEILESREQRDPWLVYVMLGSYAFVC